MSISRLIRICLVCFGLLLPLAAQTSPAQTISAEASTTVQVPPLIRLSGTLNLPSAASPSNVVNVTFALYKEETGGTSLWQETQNVEVDAAGHYAVLLGTTQSEGLPIELFTSGQAQWLGVRQQGEPEQTRIMLVSVPFALKAGDAETFGGKPPSAYVAATPLSTSSTSAVNSTAAGGGGSPSMSSTTRSLSSQPLGISGRGTPNFVPLWRNFTELVNSVIYQDPNSGHLGVGTLNASSALEVHSTDSTAILGATAGSSKNGVEGLNIATAGLGVGVFGQTASTSGYAIFGNAAASTGSTVGVYGLALSPTGTGVYGKASSATGLNAGVSGATSSPDGFGVLGTSNSQTGESAGVDGTANSPNGFGVFGSNASTTGPATGVEGNSSSTSGVGVYGLASATTGTGFGLEGTTTTPDGSGVYGFVKSAAANGVTGDNLATTGLSNGVYGLAASSSGNGVFGLNTDTTGTGSGGAGVWGQSSSPNGFGIVGLNTAGGYGVYGSSATGVGILGVCVPTGSNICFNGIAGENTSTSGAVNGVWGLTASPEGSAVYMVNTGGGDLLFGTETDGGDSTFYVQAAGNGYLAGNLDVGGAITAGTKDFKIDHPLDPANKYLVHASVESSEMMNIYTGNVTTNGEGLATVQLPEWFEALNRDFCYQLTVLGQFAQAIVSEKVANHQFRIETDKPNVEVSWQLTGVRHDAFANANRLQVEEEKALADRGHYLHPELFGAPKETRISQHSAPHMSSAIRPVPAKAARARLQPPIIFPAQPLPVRPNVAPPLLPGRTNQ